MLLFVCATFLHDVRELLIGAYGGDMIQVGTGLFWICNYGHLTGGFVARVKPFHNFVQSQEHEISLTVTVGTKLRVAKVV